MNNSASINGGAIYYNYDSPVLEGMNTFENNSAYYGNDIASYSIQANLIESDSTIILNASEA